MLKSSTRFTVRTAIKLANAGLFAGWVVAAGPVLAASQPQAEVVGEIMTSIGEGRIVSGDGQPVAAARGVRVRAGDRIETMIGGHVHIRFVDGGLVSVRPLSRLQVEAYQNGDGNRLAAIKFRLEEGVMRSMTGAWGEANRDRYRLNTPVAAIGIKGTDYVVKADPANTQASVLSGAIVMAPLEGSCAQALGPCTGENSVLLTADMAGMMLELQRQNGSTTPRLVPAVDLLASAARSGNLSQPRAETLLPRSDAVKVASVAESVPISDAGLANQVVENTAGVPLQASKPLVWLHNVFDWNVPANSISQRFDEALATGRTAVVGNFFITLYRDETVLNQFQPVGTSASFDLKSVSATYTQPVATDRPVENVAVSGATLNVDFARSTFATRLDLSSPSMGKTAIVDNGAIDKNGIFNGQQVDQKLVGAFSTDGREAGYLFSKTLPGGNLEGLTLWRR